MKKNNLITILIFSLLLSILTSSDVSAQAWPDFQTNGYGPHPLTVDIYPYSWYLNGAYLKRYLEQSPFYNFNRLGGLGFQVGVDGFPRLVKESSAYTSLFPQRIDFGKVITNEIEPAAGSAVYFDRDWAHTGVNVSSSLKMHVSRLTPSVVFDSSGSTLTFFSSAPKQPAYFAKPSGGNIQIVSSSDINNLQLNDLNANWLLVWFGPNANINTSDTNTNFLSTKGFPFTYNVKNEGGGGYLSSVDSPLLFIFENSPTTLTANPTGVTAGFQGNAGKVVMLPLYGDNYPLLSETLLWNNGLPQDVIDKANWWSKHLSEVPITARETYAYDEGTDTITNTMNITYLKIREGGTRFAPIPPMVAIAYDYGFPLQFSGNVVATSVATAIGPYKGIDNTDAYTYQIQGLGKYVKQERAANNQQTEPPWLTDKLQQEINKITQAGHLAPWYPATSNGVGWFNVPVLEWSNPGETLYYLSETLPLLSQSQEDQLKTYLTQERTNYPPETVVVLKSDEGARRERWPIDQGEINEIISKLNQATQQYNHYVVNNLIPEQNLYYLSEYQRLTDSSEIIDKWPQLKTILNPYLERKDWATVGWYKWKPGSGTFFSTGMKLPINGLGGIVDVNNHFAGLIGALRLSYKADDSESRPLLWGEFAKTAILRYSMDKYADYLYANNLVSLPTDPGWLDTYGKKMVMLWANSVPFDIYGKATYIAGQPDWMVRYLERSIQGYIFSYNWTKPDDDVRSLVHLDEFGVNFDQYIDYAYGKSVVPYIGITPELGRFLSDYSKPWAQNFINLIDENTPDWHHLMGRQSFAAENNYLLPETAYQLFMARAWILNEPIDKLEKYINVSWMEKGDLFYVHKLAETIKAYRGWEWSDEGNISPTPTPPPVHCTPLGDIDCSGQVGILDLSTLLSSFGKKTGDTGFNLKTDLDNSGEVTILDLSILLSNFGKQ